MVVPTITLLLIAFLLDPTWASNDWSKPCLNGVCYYDFPSSGGAAASGSLKIWGPPDGISDITAAAGWEIISCERDQVSQDIRLVCSDESRCGHLYQHIGAVGKVVRLPRNCGPNAFAHISRAWVPKDQSIPEHISKRLVRRDGVQPEVKALHLDTDFAAVDPAQIGGEIYFVLTGANIPGAKDVIPWPSTTESKRGLFSKAKGFVKKAIKAVKGIKVKDVLKAVVKPKKLAAILPDAVDKLTDVSIDKSKELRPFELSKRLNLVDESLSCPLVDAKLRIDVEANARAVVVIGVAAEGSIIPPKVDDLAITASITGEFNGAINLAAGLSGTVDSGRVSLIEIGIPGLDFPGLLTIGPTFEVAAQASAKLDVAAQISVGFNYKLDNATLVFPPTTEDNGGQRRAFNIGDTPLKLSVSPSAKAEGSVNVHLIPALNLGIKALGGVAEAKVFLELDASAAATLSLQSEAPTAGTGQTGRADSKPAARRSMQHIRGLHSVVGSAYHRSLRRQPSVKSSTSAGFGGCYDVVAGLDVNAGATADFFGIFDRDTKTSLFSTEVQLFERCFNEASAERRRAVHYGYRSTKLQRRLECPVDAGVEEGLTTKFLVDEIVMASKIAAAGA